MSLMMAALLAATVTSGVVVKPVANMHSKPAADSDVVSQAIYGSNVMLLEERDGWARIRTADEYTGWMQDAALRRLAAGERAYASGDRAAQVESLFANLYREPDVTKHAPLLTVPFETRLEAVAEEEHGGRWIHVRLPDDRPAWVQTGDVTLAPQRLSIAETIALSKRFLGLPYFWGGVSTFGYDCSGFTQMLCRRRGFLIPRDARIQAAWSGMLAVESDNLKPGDLVYFGKSPEKITHTGMYIGNGEFVNATTWEHPVVQISRLDDPHWAKLFVAARRLK